MAKTKKSPKTLTLSGYTYKEKTINFFLKQELNELFNKWDSYYN